MTKAAIPPSTLSTTLLSVSANIGGTKLSHRRDGRRANAGPRRGRHRHRAGERRHAIRGEQLVGDAVGAHGDRIDERIAVHLVTTDIAVRHDARDYHRYDVARGVE